MLKKAEAQYTPDIETLLSSLVKSGKPLEVTCNVFVNVRKNLAKWRPSAQKEFGNLKEAKRAFAVKKRWELPAGKLQDRAFQRSVYRQTGQMSGGISEKDQIRRVREPCAGRFDNSTCLLQALTLCPYGPS